MLHCNDTVRCITSRYCVRALRQHTSYLKERPEDRPQGLTLQPALHVLDDRCVN